MKNINDVTELFDAIFDTVKLGVDIVPGGLTTASLVVVLSAVPTLVSDWSLAAKNIGLVPTELAGMDTDAQEALILHISAKVGGFVTRPTIIAFINAGLTAVKSGYEAFVAFRAMQTDLSAPKVA